MSEVRIGVLQFPGLNCETETLRELERAGLPTRLIRWNESASRLAECAGYVIPGGFSYQDRVRAGAIAAKSPMLESVVREVERGKPILGICNGAQILVEAGLVPGTGSGQVELCLARNKVAGWEGYHARWVHVKPHSGHCFFTEGLQDPIPIVVAHGEGRFVTDDQALWGRLRDEGRFALTYCDSEGGAPEGFPENPNGSPDHVAGMSGLDGQVLAFMPHPERASLLWQVPEDLAGTWGEKRRAAVGRAGDLAADGPGMVLLKAFARLSKAGAV